MKRRQGRGPRVVCARAVPWLVTSTIALAAVVVAVHTCWATEALVLRQDDSRIMKFQKMKRVWVQDPEIVDVVVTSYNELLVYSKAVGRTRLIVWDERARHEFAVQVKPLPAAERLVRELRGILGRNLRYTIVDDGAVLVEGEVRSEAEKERIARVIAAKANGVTIHDLVTVPSPRVTPAEEYRRRFEKLFPEPFVYSIIDDDTLVIEGEVATVADKDRMERILAAAAGVKVVDLVRCLESRLTAHQQRIAGIKQAVGPQYEYLELDDDVLVISGQAESEAEGRRIEKIITAGAGDITVVNVVSVKTDTRPPAVKYAEMLRPILGPDYSFTPMGEDGLIIEGLAPTMAEETRARQILTLVADELRVVNLVSTGPLTPGERVVAMLREALGSHYQVRLVADDVVVVDGVAETSADKSRVDAAVEAAPADVKVVNLVALRAPDAEMWPATRHAEALRHVLGDELTYRVLDETTLLLEGYVETAGERARAESILRELDGVVSFINLIAVRPGPQALAQSPAEKKAETLGHILGPQYTCTVVDERTVMVQGVAPGATERERISGIIRQLATDVTVVDMTVPEEGAETTTPAQRATERLRRVVPDELRLIAVDDRTVLIEGTVPTSIERERLERIAETASQADDVHVLCLVLSQMQAQTPAARRIEGLKRILGEQFNYIVWDEETVLVEGTVESEQELERVRRILEAADSDWQVGNLVTLPAVPAPPPELDPVVEVVEHIAHTIGEPYRVWRVKGKKVVVEGTAPDAEALERLNLLLGAYEDEVEIINLARVAPAPTVSLAARAESLRAVLGEDFQVRTLQGRAIVVEAVVTTKAEAERARAIMAAMDMNDVPLVDLVTVADPRVRQVLARVKVLDVNRGHLKRLGVNWGQLFDGTFADQPFLFEVEGGLGTVGDIAASLDMLKTEDAARVLAEPNLVVNEGEEASIVVGGEVPIPVPQVGAGVASIAIEYKEYGVVLRMQPTINPDGKSLKLGVAPEVSSIDPATQVSIGGIAVPAFRTRKAETIVDMPDGATLIIGGLIQHDQSKVVRSIPLLGKLPIIGELFRSTEWRQGFTELVILVTCEILQTTKP